MLDLGILDYDAAYTFQRDVARRRISCDITEDVLLLVQHPAVVTLGRSTKPGSLLSTTEFLDAEGVQLRDVERGGDITVHEPGQLVAYPIIDLKRHTKDLHWYLRQVEASVIFALALVGIDAGRSAGQTGVWRDGRKLASIGVHAREWVTWHGVALNVENDLTTFAHVVPCGIQSVEMTTVVREAKRLSRSAPTFGEMRDAVITGFGEVFGLQVTSAPDWIGALREAHGSS